MINLVWLYGVVITCVPRKVRRKVKSDILLIDDESR
jgi:hypothetical protein